MSELTGKRALVTGASSGIGAAIARALAADGVDLILTARRRDALEAVAAACRSTCKVEILPADLGQPDAARTLWTAARALGPLDILVNNAGFGYFRPFIEADWQRDAELLQLNIVSLVELCRRFIDDRSRTAASAPSYLLNMSSIGAYQAVPNMAMYTSSKVFVRNFTEALHDELRGTPIRVTCVCPGNTATEFHEAAGAGSYGWLADLAMMTADAVAAKSLRALRSGKRIIIPGAQNKLASWSVRLVTRRVASWLASRVLGKPRPAALPERTSPT